jgi:hypothetical protein
MRLAVVEWEDACEIDSTPWEFEPEEHTYTPYIVTQVGYVCYDGPEGIILTSAYGSGQLARRNQIPRGMIRNTTYLDTYDG